MRPPGDAQPSLATASHTTPIDHESERGKEFVRLTGTAGRAGHDDGTGDGSLAAFPCPSTALSLTFPLPFTAQAMEAMYIFAKLSKEEQRSLPG